MEQQIRFCTSADGTRIAYATYGDALEAPLVCVWGWGAAQEHLWKRPDGRAWCEAFSQGRRLVTFDRRGAGGSQRDVDDLSLEAQVADVAAIVDHLKLERFDLFGVDFDGSAISVAYAVEHADRIARQVLWRPLVHEPRSEEETRVAVGLMRANWSRALQLFAALRFPKGPVEEQLAAIEHMRETNSADIAARYYELDATIDLRLLLPQVQAPTLVLTRRGNREVLDGSRAVAGLLPDARFVTAEGDEPFAYGDEVLRVVLEFLDEERTGTAPATRAAGLVTILFTDITDSTALTQRLGDAKAQELVRAHNTIVRDALRAQGGTEIKHTGDGIMASFPSASGALECAVAIQRAVDGHSRTSNQQPATSDLSVHVGLNAGEPVAEEQDLFGTAVQLARRICDAAAGGEIMASDVVRQLAAGKGFVFADRGESALRGFEEPVRLYEVRWREEV